MPKQYPLTVFLESPSDDGASRYFSRRSPRQYPPSVLRNLFSDVCGKRSVRRYKRYLSSQTICRFGARRLCHPTGSVPVPTSAVDHSHPAGIALRDCMGSEKGEMLLRGVGTLRYCFPPNVSVQWQPDVLTIHTKKWFLGARFLGAPPISLMGIYKRCRRG